MKYVIALLVAVSLVLVPAYADEVPVSEPVEVVEEAAEPVLESEVQSGGSDSGSDSGDGLAIGASDIVEVFSEQITVEELAAAIVLAEEQNAQVFTLVDDEISGGCYMDVDSSIGSIRIFIPADYQYGSFSYFGNNVACVRSSTITGYSFINGSLYQIRFQPFSIPQYRDSESSYSYNDFDITNVVDTNVQIMDSFDDLPLYASEGQLDLIYVFLLGVIVLCLFMKRW